MTKADEAVSHPVAEQVHSAKISMMVSHGVEASKRLTLLLPLQY